VMRALRRSVASAAQPTPSLPSTASAAKMDGDAKRYEQRGVSADKGDVHAAIKKLVLILLAQLSYAQLSTGLEWFWMWCPLCFRHLHHGPRVVSDQREAVTFWIVLG